MTLRPRLLSYLALVGSLLAVALAVRVVDPFFVRGLRLIAFDSLQRLDPGVFDPTLPVRVVDIDEASLAALGQWPWPRTLVGGLLKALEANGAAAIAFDMLFAEPDRTSLDEIVKHLPAAQAALLGPAVSAQPSNDAVLADALAQSPSVLATSLGDGENHRFEPKAGFAIAGDDPHRFIPSFAGASENLPALQAAAKGIGFINWSPDRDQVVRRIALLYRIGDGLVPALAAEALRVAQGASTYVLKSSNASGETAFGRSTGLNHVRIGDAEIPTDAAGGVYFKFRRYDPAAYLSAWKVLAGKIPPAEIAGKIILIGTSAPGLLDLRATPVDAAVPGVEIHAQLLEHMLTGRFLSRPDYALALEELLVLVGGALLALILPLVSSMVAATAGLVVVGSALAGSWAAFRYAGLFLDPTYPALALGSITAVITSYVYRQVEAQRSDIRHAFGRYLAPSVVEEIIADPQRLELGGVERDLTLMFCDVRNFTSISEHLSATELTHFINELLSPLSEIILSRRGTIDKYMGDAIMAFWNAPLDDPDHALHACRAAIDMAARMADLNRRWEEQAAAAGRPFARVNIGIGINTGRCCVGNLGSTYRFDYSAVGDEVNVTSRLEGLSKTYGMTVILSDQVVASAKDIATLELDLVRVKGRTRPVRIHTVLDILGDDRNALDRLKEIHSQFLVAYRGREWDDAEKLLTACRAVGIGSLEPTFSLFRSRIAALRQANLPSDWDGAAVMSEK